MAQKATGSKDGKGSVQINFVPQETLLQYRGVGTTVAKQILQVRKVLRNKLKKEDFHTYGIYKKGETVIHHFDFTENPDDACLEDEDFEYHEPLRNDITDKFRDQTATNDARSNGDGDQGWSKTSQIKRPRMKDLPHDLYFDGRGDLDAFKRKFNYFVTMEDYDSVGQFFALKMMLRGTASEYIDYLAEKGKVDNCVDAFIALRDQFNNEINVHEALVNLRSAKQKPKESYEEFEMRLIRMAKQAYPKHVNFDHLQSEVAMSFMTGLSDINARGYLAGNVREATMKEIKKVLGSFNFMNNVKNSRDVRKINGGDLFSDENSSDEEPINSVRQVESHRPNYHKVTYDVQPNNYRGYQNDRRPNRLDKVEDRVGRLEVRMDNVSKDVREIKELVIALTNDISQLKNDNPREKASSRPSSLSRSSSLPRRNSIDKSNIMCHECGEMGHYQRECPKNDPKARGSD